MSTEHTVVSSLQSALETELSFKPADHRFTAEELAMFDQLHTRGFAATVELAHALGILPDVHVLDIGAGLGGPARYLSETFGCSVEGIDASRGIVDAANYLSTRWVGLEEALVSFSVGDASNLSFPDSSFDLVWMQHVAMNVADRERLYNEVYRVLRPGGRFATYDVLRLGELVYPTPWAANASVSTVLTADETRDAIEQAGLEIISFTIDTPAALEWVRKTAAAIPAGERPPGALMLRAGLGESFRTVVGNLGKNYLEGRADVAAIIAQRR
jgi:sarcosine/dimethylglycine N-methyltransferase